MSGVFTPPPLLDIDIVVQTLIPESVCVVIGRQGPKYIVIFNLKKFDSEHRLCSTSNSSECIGALELYHGP